MSIELREVTLANLRDVDRLAVAPGQEGLVAPVGRSIAQAHLIAKEEPHRQVHHRAAYVGDAPVGFVLWEVQPAGSEFAGWYLGRLLIDAPHQRQGYGSQVLDTLVSMLRSSSDQPKVLWTSYDPREDGARGFYVRYGFVVTGQTIDDDEEVARLDA